MARSDVDLANAALRHLVRERLRNLDGGDIAPVTLKANMADAIEYVLEEYDWPEARVVKALETASSVSLRGYAYAYKVPTDLVKIWYFGNEAGTVRYDYERGMSSDLSSDRSYFFSNSADAFIRYSSNRIGVARLSVKIFELVAIRLAWICCMPLTKNEKLWAKLEQSYDKELSKIKTLVANAEPEVIDVDFVPQTILDHQ